MTTTQIALTRTILREVASLAQPPLKPSKLLTGDPRADDYHIARLRGICAARMMEQGISLKDAGKVFGQADTTTLHQVKRTPAQIQSNPRFQQFSAGLAATL